MAVYEFPSALVGGLLRVIEPLEDGLKDTSSFAKLMVHNGWQAPETDGFLPGVQAIFALAPKLEGVRTSLFSLAHKADFSLKDAEDLLALGKDLVTTIRALIGRPAPNNLPFPLNQQAFWNEFPGDLLAELFVSFLEDEHASWFAPLMLLGIVSETEVAADEAVGRIAHTKRALDWDRLGSLLTSPEQLAAQVYGWGGELDWEKLFRRMVPVLRALGAPARTRFLGNPAATDYYDEGSVLEGRQELRVPIFHDRLGDLGFVELGLSAFPIPAANDRNGLAKGLFVGPFGAAEAGAEIQLSGSLTLKLRGGLELSGPVGLEIRPQSFTARLPAPAEKLDLGAELAYLPPEPLRLFGERAAPNIALQDATVALELRGPAASPELQLALRTSKLVFQILPSEGDGFLGKFLGETASSFELRGGLAWSSKRGLVLEGSGGLSLNLPVHIELGPVKVSGLTVSVATGDKTSLSVGVTGSVALGPVTATIEDVGAALTLEPLPANQAGIFGSLDVGFDIKPPTGVGISINAGGITGGGFIKYEDGRYAGVLELKIYSVAVKAFGVIDTKMPDGSKGFSFVIVISAEFTAIQLGLGFTLLGVGGLLGIHRRLDEDALRNAVREGHIENVLFPRNLVARAPEVIRDLTALFPAAEDHYVFGPMAKLGWGTPTLIRADLGIILQLPGPILSLLGEVHCELPSQEAAVVKLHLSVAGQLDFAAKKFELFASLHDSVIQGFPVHGQMAMLLRWGEKPVFALAVGGFHPAFQPPPGFPALKRMSVDLGRNGNPSILLTGFFAITSNTAQVGGALALHASGSGVTLDASISVKAIFIFSPFAFEAEIDAGVRVSFHGRGIGVRLHGMLSGPSPWRVRGEVCVSILWWDACLGFNKTFGSGRPVELPEIDPFTGPEGPGSPENIPGLQDAITDPRSWEPVTPAGVFQVVSLAQGVGDKPPFDPMGTLSMRQKVVPLETPQKIVRFGSAKAKNPRAFKLSRATVGAKETTLLAKAGTFSDNFAPAQYFELKANEKLSAPSFEERVAGYAFAANPNDVSLGSVGGLDVKYKTTVRDSRPPVTPPPAPFEYPLPGEHLDGMLAKGAAGKLGIGRQGDLRYIDPGRPDRFRHRTPKYVLADKGSLAPRTDLFVASTKLDAMLTLRDQLADDPVTFTPLQIAPEHEVLAVVP
jgi:hypothetical protein